MRFRTFPILFVLAAVALAAPVSATYLLTGYTLSPDQPLVPGAAQQVVAGYTLLPTGTSNFVRGHELQMQTSLSGAQWNIQVVVDGRNAAQQTASGAAAFISGELLSYPTNHDVSLVVTVSGTVPPGTAGPVPLILAEEIDNSGNIVPGSSIAISRPVQGANATAPATTPPGPPPPSPSLTGAAPAPTPRSPGFETAAGAAAVAAAIAPGRWRRRHRQGPRHTKQKIPSTGIFPGPGL